MNSVAPPYNPNNDRKMMDSSDSETENNFNKHRAITTKAEDTTMAAAQNSNLKNEGANALNQQIGQMNIKDENRGLPNGNMNNGGPK